MAVIPSDPKATLKPYFTHPFFPLHGSCTDFVLQNGMKFNGSLLIDKSLFTDGSTLTFTWGANVVEMTLDSALAPEDYGAIMYSDAAEFAFSAAASVLLNADFDFVLAFDSAFFTIVDIGARNYGSAYDLVIASSTGATSYLTESPGVDVELNNDLTVLCDIYQYRPVDIKTDFKGTLKSALVFNNDDSSNEFNFDLAEFMHRCLKQENIFYTFSGIFSLADTSCAKFKLALRQSSGWIGAYPIDSYTMLRGGLTKRDYLRTNTDFFAIYTDSAIWRLINHVKEYTDLYVDVCRNQILLTSIFINLPEINMGFTPVITITDVFNATASVDLTLFPVTLTGMNKYMVRCGFIDLDVQGKATANGLGDVASWSIKMIKEYTLVEYEIGFWRLIANDYRENFFIFENSLGGLQPIRTLGQHEYGTEIDKEEFEKDITLANLVDERFMISETYAHIFKGEVFSGWLNQEDIYNYLDFLNSENIWKQDDDKQALVPIKILKGNWTIFTNSNNGVKQYGFTLKYVETTRDKHVTDLIPL